MTAHRKRLVFHILEKKDNTEDNKFFVEGINSMLFDFGFMLFSFEWGGFI